MLNIDWIPKNIPKCPGEKGAPLALRRLFSILKERKGWLLRDNERIEFNPELRCITLHVSGEAPEMDCDTFAKITRPNGKKITIIDGETVYGHKYKFIHYEGKEEKWQLLGTIDSWTSFWKQWIQKMDNVRVV